MLPSNQSVTESDNVSSVIPGVMEIDWVPSVGRSRTNQDPASLVAKELYAHVRAAFSGQLAVDPPDLLLYLIALDSIYSYIGSLKRIYRVLTAYSPFNYAIPDQLLCALGIPQNRIPSWKNNRMELLSYVNQLIGMTNKFICPVVMDMFNRHYWMNDNIYFDAPSPNSQVFAFRQAGWYRYCLFTDQDTGIKFGGCQLLTSSDDVQSWFNSPELAFLFGQNLIQALAGSEDAYTISGYFARAYDGVNAFRVDPLMPDEVLEPVYVEEVLQQIENAKAVSNIVFPSNETLTVNKLNASMHIFQDPSTNAVIAPNSYVVRNSNASHTSAATITMPGFFLSARMPQPTYQDVITMSRLATTAHVYSTTNLDGNTGADYRYYIESGTEVVSNIKLWTTSLNAQGLEAYSNNSIPIEWNSLLLQDATIDQLARYMQFDWAPLLVYTNSNGVVSVLGDIHNLTVVNRHDAHEINKMCILSELNAYSLQ